MIVKGFGDIRLACELLEEKGKNFDGVSQYIMTTPHDLKGLRILLSRQLFADDFKIVEKDEELTMLEWIDRNPKEVPVIYAYIDSAYFHIFKFESGQPIPTMTDNQLLYFTVMMLYNIQAYGLTLQNVGEIYRGEDDEKLFDHYGVMVEDLIKVIRRTGMEIDLQRDHIINEIESRPDGELLMAGFFDL